MPRPPVIRAAQPCPHCGGALTLRRCKVAHRKRFCCDCGYSERLAEATRLRLTGYKELFDLENNDERPT